MDLRWMGPGDVDAVVAAAHLFDDRPTADGTVAFLAQEGNHLCIAYSQNGEPAGFVSGIETLHPDKGPEMLLYELGVDEAHHRQGYGRALTDALAQRARSRGCVGMWVLTDADNVVAVATYRSAGAAPPTGHVMLAWDLSTP